jgi:hypothetical protein
MKKYIMDKLKDFGLSVLSAFIVTIGVLCVVAYLSLEFSIFSLFFGLIGYFIIYPLIKHYKKEIVLFFEEENKNKDGE